MQSKVLKGCILRHILIVYYQVSRAVLKRITEPLKARVSNSNDLLENLLSLAEEVRVLLTLCSHVRNVESLIPLYILYPDFRTFFVEISCCHSTGYAV